MIVRYLVALSACLAVAACNGNGAGAHKVRSPAGANKTGDTTPHAGLQPFADERAFDALLQRWSAKAEARRKEQEAQWRRMQGASDTVANEPPPPPVAPIEAAAVADAAEESITNVQTAGVDEGGIVKRHGDHLVVLRRGRLFTVRIGDDSLQPVATVDAFGPGVDPSGAWYDEMLIGGDTVVVIGYSYARGGTELVLFDITADGGLAYRDTYHLRSNDYYSSRNYASRLIGTTLVLYTPMHINAWNPAPQGFMPSVRRWHPQATPDEFKRILPATRIYRTDEEPDPFAGELSLHTVTRCDLSARELDCTASAVLGPMGRLFYVSADSVFVWTTHYGPDVVNMSSVFRIPLDDSTPTALKTRGAPIDQLSFLHGADGYLNVLVSQVGTGEGMWGDRNNAGDLALLRVPLASFGDGHDAAPVSAYRRLPGEAQGSMQNRFVGDWLLYSSAPYHWAMPAEGKPGGMAYAVRYAQMQAVQALPLGHGAERIEVMGQHAIVVGSAKNDLHFTSIRLGDRNAVSGSTYVQTDATQGESRTHGFFYRAESAQQGVVGLPVISQRRDNSMQRYLSDSAAVLYLRNRDLQLAPLGELTGDSASAIDDHCQASCVDWYGNARPIFIGERVFALLGYELVEGRIVDERIVERRRSSFAPGAVIAR